MRIYSKITLALLTAALSASLALGQNASPAPGQSSPGTNGQAMHRQQMGPRSAWNNNGPRWGGGNWRGMHGRGRRHREFMLACLVSKPGFRERIGMTPEQAQKIRTETSDFRKNQIRSRADLQVKYLELKDLLSADNPDRSVIDQKLQEISTVRLAQAKSAIDFHLDMRSALTPDQKQKLRQMREDFFRHRGFGPGGPGGPKGDTPSPNTNGY